MVPYAAEQAPALLVETPTGRLLAGRTMSFGVFALGWVLFGLASVRARVFPRDAAILLIIGGGIGLWIAVVPGADAPLAVAVAWIRMWLLRSDRGGQVEPVPPRRR